jgi:hypothetical protein
VGYVGVAEDEAARADDLGQQRESEEKSDAEAGQESAASARHETILDLTP